MTNALPSPPKGAYRWLVLAAATFAQATASFAMLGVAALAGFLQQDFKLVAARDWLADHRNLWRGGIFAVVRRRPARPQERTADHRHRRHDRLYRVARRHAQRQFRRASVVPVRRRLRFQRDPARRQQIGIGLVSRRPAGLGDGHSSGRPAAWRRAGGGDLACRGGGVELAHRRSRPARWRRSAARSFSHWSIGRPPTAPVPRPSVRP